MEDESQTNHDASQDEFRHRLAHLQAWAVVSASRAHDLSYEWPAVAFGLAALYLLLVASPRNTLGFLDIVVLVGVLGTGFSLRRFERNSSAELERLVEHLASQENDSGQPGESSLHATDAPVVAPAKPTLDRLADFIGDCFARLFSEARVLARMKLWAFASFLTFVGLGFVLRLSDLGGSTGARIAEFVLSSPGLAQTIAALVALLFILLANLHSRVRRQEYEKELLRMAADPSTPEDVRRAILKKLEGR